MAWKKGIEVKVLVNGNAAQEYDDNDEEQHGPNTVTKYCETISGAEFAVQFELKPSFRFRCELIRCGISIDGRSLDASFVRKQGFEERPRGYLEALDGIMRSHGTTWSIEKFCFSEIKTSDDSTQITDNDLKNRTADMGTISLRLDRMHKGVYHPPGSKGSRWDWDELTDPGTLPEKALKGQALSHGASLGLPQFSEPVGTWEGCEYLDGEDSPFLVFKFKYRSRSAYRIRSTSASNANNSEPLEALQDLRIIHRTPTPVPLEERPIEELSIDEARELLRRQKERQEGATAQTKAEIKPQHGIKREYKNDEEYSALLGSARANKVPRIFEEGEVIDLLED